MQETPDWSTFTVAQVAKRAGDCLAAIHRGDRVNTEPIKALSTWLMQKFNDGGSACPTLVATVKTALWDAKLLEIPAPGDIKHHVMTTSINLGRIAAVPQNFQGIPQAEQLGTFCNILSQHAETSMLHFNN